MLALPRPRLRTLSLWTTIALAASGCSILPTAGPSTSQIQGGTERVGDGSIQIMEVDDKVTSQLLAHKRQKSFSESLGQAQGPALTVAPGDTLEVDIWEAPPATLFGGGAVDSRAPAVVRATTLPEQVVDVNGFVMIPFVGRIHVGGQSTADIANRITQGLAGKANQPQVLVRTVHTPSANVTVVGEVVNSLRMPLTPSGERLLDALAAAGGVRQPVNKMTLQVTRGDNFYALPLDVVIRDPHQNVPLHAGDVVTAMFQPLSFTALGATGKNEEVGFETQGISLAQALARSGGLADARSDRRGVFIFRFEPLDAQDWPNKPVATTADGLVPVVYRLDLSQPRSLFVMQNFMMANKDVLYVSDAPAAELQKFLNLVFSVVYPVLTTVQVTRQ